MKWLTVWLLLTAVYLGALLACRLLGGDPLLTRADLPNLLLIPAVQSAALAGVAALAATSAPRRKP
jgi:hypothetical protein